MINLVMDGVFLGATRVDYVRKSDNKQAAYFNCSVKQGGAVETLPCQQSVFDAYNAGVIQDFTPCRLTVTYDSRYGRVSVVDVISQKK